MVSFLRRALGMKRQKANQKSDKKYNEESQAVILYLFNIVYMLVCRVY